MTLGLEKNFTQTELHWAVLAAMYQLLHGLLSCHTPGIDTVAPYSPRAAGQRAIQTLDILTFQHPERG